MVVGRGNHQPAVSQNAVHQFPLQLADSTPPFAVNELTGDGVVTNPSSVSVLRTNLLHHLAFMEAAAPSGSTHNPQYRSDAASLSTDPRWRSGRQTSTSSISSTITQAGGRHHRRRDSRIKDLEHSSCFRVRRSRSLMTPDCVRLKVLYPRVAASVQEMSEFSFSRAKYEIIVRRQIKHP